LNNPDRLKAMKAAYLSVLDPSLVDPAEQTKLNDVIKADPSYAINPGWMEVGGKWDVPKHAWRVGRCGKTYVWVMPDRAEDFSRFVLLTLNLAFRKRGSNNLGACGPRLPGLAKLSDE
jgi:hypothetical protein